jgi:hypothetical protein
VVEYLVCKSKVQTPVSPKKKKPIKQHKKDQQQKPTESMHVFLLAALPLFCLFVRLFAPHTHCLLNKATRIQSWDFS